MKLIKLEKNNCTPCKMLDNFMTNELGVTPDEKYDLLKDPSKAMQFKDEHGNPVMQVPVLIAVDENGVEVDRVQGQGQNKITNFLKQNGFI